MLHIPNDLSVHISAAIQSAQTAEDLPDFDTPEVKVMRARNPDHGDYATPVAMQLAGIARRKPDEIAVTIVNHFPEIEYLSSVERAGGFINFRLADAWLQQQVDAIIEQGDDIIDMGIAARQRAQVECVSANPTGPITVGRVRGGVMGDTLARLLRASGYDVELEYYFNNAGRQMRLLGLSVQARYRELLELPHNFPEDGYQGDYVYNIAQQLVDARGKSLIDANWEPFKDYAEEIIFGMIRQSLKRIGIIFDSFFNENSLYEDNSVWDTLKRLEEKGLTYQAKHPERDADYEDRPDEEELDAQGEGGEAVWIKMRKLRDVKKDKALVKSNGEPTYRLPDVAYHISKYERGFDVLVNILGADHIEEAKDVRAMLDALGYDTSRLHVPLHQFVTLTESGETKRMSTRRGEFVTLDELVDDVGVDAVRYFMLARSPDSEMVFDIDLARKKSNENPVYYIQNAHVRCASISRVADERNMSLEDGDVTLLNDPRELTLIRRLVELPEIIELCIQEMEPHRLAFWAHEELSSTFHPVYEEVRALHSDVSEDVAKARLKLYAATRIVIRQTLNLMGMSAPHSM